jgi:hypothetical protein
MVPLAAKRILPQLFFAEMVGVGLDVGDAVPPPVNELHFSGDAAKSCVCNQHAGNLVVPGFCQPQAHRSSTPLICVARLLLLPLAFHKLQVNHHPRASKEFSSILPYRWLCWGGR